MEQRPKPSLLALLPLALFFILYLVVSIIVGDFYKMPITVAFVVASIVAVAMCSGYKFQDRVTHFSKGASDKNIMLMVWIFILAGAFAQSAKAMGAVEATVNLTMELLPSNMLLVGIFIAACFISFSVGTSVGTVVALVPIATGIAPKIGVDVAYLTAIIVGGAFFGDNMSFISDTTIAATQSQGCSMSDKFKANIQIILPAAIVATAIYVFQGINIGYLYEPKQIEWLRVIPYLAVIVLAVMGLNVMKVLVVGIALSGVIGLSTGGFTIWEYTQSMGNGIGSMGELIIITMLAGGLLELIRMKGGLEWLIGVLTRGVNNKRMAELSIAAMVSVANLCTANNTVAIITTGKISKDIATRFGVDPRRSASIMDTFSCFVQGLLPYGAQLLMASQLSGVTPPQIIASLYYPMLIGLFGVAAILLRYPRKYA
ncbi:MAG: Na+/H+ antiporter NhaC family protein [Rikenellaceae bacterium]